MCRRSDKRGAAAAPAQGGDSRGIAPAGGCGGLFQDRAPGRKCHGGRRPAIKAPLAHPRGPAPATRRHQNAAQARHDRGAGPGPTGPRPMTAAHRARGRPSREPPFAPWQQLPAPNTMVVRPHAHCWAEGASFLSLQCGTRALGRKHMGLPRPASAASTECVATAANTITSCWPGMQPIGSGGPTHTKRRALNSCCMSACLP